ncbi:hypothetical protein BBOV_I004120 [Babesia bovis T2Bo]|uniref:Uncharacterized protein n=1 Tax=Babesia bovis TaxID=5865 RepID=A7AWR5_BABBO|nr:hypothetical protein BBOV_I004120 [Babesia bovis T2Bo]EDO05493.1 hypothetical protein BBOV_I004120 [Babesia bovis T2Bo]|eukprot:XP_001609061.1 hypothetical protein [Babesia bovis T2Bo]
MCNSGKRRTLGFESLTRILKKLAQEATLPAKDPNNAIRIVKKLKPVIKNALTLINEHPFHAPVVAHNIASVTRKLNIPSSVRCATCGGTCIAVHTEFVQCVPQTLQYLTPKGIMQLQTVYSGCRNQKLDSILKQIDLKALTSIYLALLHNVDWKTEFEANVFRIISRNRVQQSLGTSDRSAECNSTNDILEDFGRWYDEISAVSHDSVVNGPHFDVYIRDICDAVVNVNKAGPSKQLIFYFAYVALQQINLENVTSEEVKSICRILHHFHICHYPAKTVEHVIRKLVRHCSHLMNFKDISCILPMIDVNDLSLLKAIVKRIDDILDNYESSDSYDPTGVSVIVKQLGRIIKRYYKDLAVQTAINCVDQFVRFITRRSAGPYDPQTLSASVTILSTLQSLLYLPELLDLFINLLTLLTLRLDDFFHTTNTYNATELLNIMAPICETYNGYNETVNVKNVDWYQNARLKTIVNANHLKKLISHHSTVYQSLLSTFGDKDSNDEPRIRDLCRFLEIYRKHSLHRIHVLSEDFNAAIHDLLLLHHQSLKLIDAVELTAYLSHMSNNQGSLNNIITQIDDRVKNCTNVDELLYRRVKALSATYPK